MVAKAGHGECDDVFFDVLQARVIDLESVQDSATRVVEDRVDAPHEGIKSLARRARGQVDCKPTLAPVVDKSGFAEGVPGWCFHLDHVGAELGKQRTSVRASQNRAEVQYTEACERTLRLPRPGS